MGVYEDFIGRCAGIVWNTLNTLQEPCSINRLKTETDLKEREVWLALGWLAREGKIVFYELDNKIRVQLTGCELYF